MSHTEAKALAIIRKYRLRLAEDLHYELSERVDQLRKQVSAAADAKASGEVVTTPRLCSEPWLDIQPLSCPQPLPDALRLQIMELLQLYEKVKLSLEEIILNIDHILVHSHHSLYRNLFETRVVDEAVTSISNLKQSANTTLADFANTNKLTVNLL